MGFIATELKKISVSAISPDGAIWAETSHNGQTLIGFEPGAYEHYAAHELASQLAIVLQRLWDAYDSRFTEVVASRGVRVNDLTDAWRTEVRLFVTESQRLHGIGTGDDAEVRVKTTGLKQWEVRIAPRAMSRHDRTSMAEEVVIAMNHAVRRYHQKVDELRAGYLDHR